MKNLISIRIVKTASLTALLPLLPLAAGADGGEPAGSFTANASVVSDYAYRGWSQTNEDPALQGGFDYAHSSGLYAGTWGSNVSWLSDADAAISNSLELDIYSGYRGSAGVLGYDVGVLGYYYPGSYPNGFNSPDTLEGYAALSWEFLTFKYSYCFTDLFGAADSKGSQYFDLSAVYEVGAGVKLGAHIGRQDIAGPSESYYDWKVSVSKSFGGFDFTVAYVDTDVDDADLADERAILSVGRVF